MSLLEDEFGDIIKKARQGHGMTCDDVAKKASIPVASLQKIEGCMQTPTLHEIQTIAPLLSLDPSPLEKIGRNQWHPREIPSWVGKNVATILGNINGYEVKGYLLHDTTTRDAIMIDTAYSPEKMLQHISALDLNLKAVCLTHGHHDHAHGIDKIVMAHPTTVYLGQGDMSMVKEYPLHIPINPALDGHTIDIGSIKLHFIATPGHTPGGICYSTGPVCFVGDTLFAGSIGRSCPSTLYSTHLQSIKSQIFYLDNSTILLPGHGPATTVGEEKAHNPFVANQALQQC